MAWLTVGHGGDEEQTAGNGAAHRVLCCLLFFLRQLLDEVCFFLLGKMLDTGALACEFRGEDVFYSRSRNMAPWLGD